MILTFLIGHYGKYDIRYSMRSWLFLFIIFFTQSIQAMDGCTPLPDSDSELFHCKTFVGNYSRPVHFYIPTNLDYTQSLKMLVHFHGHNLAGYDHFYRTEVKGQGYGDYGEFLLAANINGIVVVPESLGNCSTYDNFFSDQKNAIDFFNEIQKKVSKASNNEMPVRLILSAHSGAYRVLNRLAGYANLEVKPFSQLTAIGLFDATYGSVPNIVKWVKNKLDKNDEYIFYDSYVSGIHATAENGSVKLKKEFQTLTSNNIFFFPITGKKSQSLLDQHFNVLKTGSLTKFWQIP